MQHKIVISKEHMSTTDRGRVAVTRALCRCGWASLPFTHRSAAIDMWQHHVEKVTGRRPKGPR